MVNAAIVTKWKFVSGSNKKFQTYIDYIDRDEATRSKVFTEYNLINVDGYNHYMENPEKSSGLFTENKNELTVDERKKVKQLFQQAQKNDSVMWQDVVSFDTTWLVEQGIYDEENHVLDEAKVMNAVRSAMKEQLQAEQLSQSAIWTGAIHYNELHHIHVHLAIVEPEPTRPYGTFTRKDGSTYEARRGFRSKKNIDRFKSQVISQLVDRDQPLAQISSLIRTQIGQHKGKMKRLPDSELRYLYERIYQGLPADRRSWKYNMNALNETRPLIDRFTSTYLANYEQSGYRELITLLDENVQFYQTVYGTGTKEFERAQDFKTNKVQELYTTLGNSLLKEMSEQAKLGQQSGNFKHGSVNWNSAVYHERPVAKANLSKVKKALNKDFQSVKNQQEYIQNLRKQTEQDQGFTR